MNNNHSYVLCDNGLTPGGKRRKLSPFPPHGSCEESGGIVPIFFRLFLHSGLSIHDIGPKEICIKNSSKKN